MKKLIPAAAILVLLAPGCAALSGWQEQSAEKDDLRGRLSPSPAADDALEVILRAAPADAELDAQLAKSVTLSQAQDAAVRRNPDLVAALERWVAFLERVPQKMLPGPTSGTGYPMPSVAYRYAPMLKMNEAVVAFGIPFPTKLLADADAALAEARAARADFKDRELMLRSATASAYAQLYLVQRELAIVSSNIALLDRLTETAEGKLTAGTIALPDVLRAKIDRASLQAEKATLDRAVVAARGTLNVLLDRRPDAALGPLAPLADPMPTEDVSALYEKGLAERPDLLAAGERVTAADAMHSRARQEWIPDIALGVGFMEDFEANRYFPEAVAGITLPVFPSTINARIRETEAEARRARAEARSARNRVFDEITQQWTRVVAAADRHRIFAKDAVPQAEAAIKAAEAAWVANKLDFLALIDTQRQLLAKQLDRERALAEYTMARAELDRAIGGRR